MARSAPRPGHLVFRTLRCSFAVHSCDPGPPKVQDPEWVAALRSSHRAPKTRVNAPMARCTASGTRGLCPPPAFVHLHSAGKAAYLSSMLTELSV
jgi:hypothetical protein